MIKNKVFLTVFIKKIFIKKLNTYFNLNNKYFFEIVKYIDFIKTYCFGEKIINYI